MRTNIVARFKLEESPAAKLARLEFKKLGKLMILLQRRSVASATTRINIIVSHALPFLNCIMLLVLLLSIRNSAARTDNFFDQLVTLVTLIMLIVATVKLAVIMFRAIPFKTKTECEKVSSPFVTHRAIQLRTILRYSNFAGLSCCTIVIAVLWIAIKADGPAEVPRALFDLGVASLLSIPFLFTAFAWAASFLVSQGAAGARRFFQIASVIPAVITIIIFVVSLAKGSSAVYLAFDMIIATLLSSFMQTAEALTTVAYLANFWRVIEAFFLLSALAFLPIPWLPKKPSSFLLSGVHVITSVFLILVMLSFGIKISPPHIAKIGTRTNRICEASDLANEVFRRYGEFPIGVASLKMADGRRGLIITLAGTELSSREDTWIRADVEEFFDVRSKYEKAVFEIVEERMKLYAKYERRLPDVVMLAGHSLGGMVAEQVAADISRVLTAKQNSKLIVVAFGSPAIKRMPKSTVIVRIDEPGDFVPATGSLLAPIEQALSYEVFVRSVKWPGALGPLQDSVDRLWSAIDLFVLPVGVYQHLAYSHDNALRNLPVPESSGCIQINKTDTYDTNGFQQ